MKEHVGFYSLRVDTVEYLALLQISLMNDWAVYRNKPDNKTLQATKLIVINATAIIEVSPAPQKKKKKKSQ